MSPSSGCWQGTESLLGTWQGPVWWPCLALTLQLPWAPYKSWSRGDMSAGLPLVSPVSYENDVGQCVLQAPSWSEFGPWASSWNRQHLPVPLVLLCPGEMQEEQAKQMIPGCRSPSQTNHISWESLIQHLWIKPQRTSMEETWVGSSSHKAPPVLFSHMQAANIIEQATKAAQDDSQQALELVRMAVSGEAAASGSLQGLLQK